MSKTASKKPMVSFEIGEARLAQLNELRWTSRISRSQIIRSALEKYLTSLEK